MMAYLIENTVTGKYYVGQTTISVKKRWSNHVSAAKAGLKTHLASAIRKYKVESFTVSILSSADNKNQLDGLEKLWIILLRSSEPAFGYNLTLGGEGVLGFKHPHTDETKQQISRSLRTRYKNVRHHLTGTRQSTELCIRKSRTLRGHPVSSLTINRMRDRAIARSYSEETKEKARLMVQRWSKGNKKT